MELLRKHHPAWRLLAASNAPYVIAFLHGAFVRDNIRTLSQSELRTRLDDFAHHLRTVVGEGALPRRSAQYLTEWADDEHGWLRRYYPDGSDEPHFDLSPAAEKAIEWIASLEQAHFVGTESRLNIVFELLREMVSGSQSDPDLRIAHLQAQRDALDAEIDAVQRGQMSVLEPSQLRDRFLQVEQTARALLTDFRQVEQNFRDLDREVRERVALWEGSKGEILETMFGEQDVIAGSDQGRSFRAFWDLLMAPERSEELTSLLEQVIAMPAVAELDADPRTPRMYYDWLDAGEAAQRTVRRLSEQLRRYLDDEAWQENRRIMQIIRTIEQHAVAVRADPPSKTIATIDATAPTINLPMDRPLFTRPFNPTLSARPGEADPASVDPGALYEQVHIDKDRLRRMVSRALSTRPQVGLTSIIADNPLQHGLAELIAWLSIATESDDAVIDEAREQSVTWRDEDGTLRRARLPAVTFVRQARGTG